MDGRFAIFGASVTGPGHKRAGLPNQDACLSFVKEGRIGIVLSDGLGSCCQSDKGSKAVCCAVVSAMELESASLPFDMTRFLENIKHGYCESIDADEYVEYLATCLWCFCPGDGRVYAGMLGDGMVAIIDGKNTVTRMIDTKADGFSNVVSSLSPKTELAQWQTLALHEDDCDRVMLCSDGVSDDLVDLDGFVREFFKEYGGRSTPGGDIATMLEKWPVPLHTDDKTIICMARRRL